MNKMAMSLSGLMLVSMLLTVESKLLYKGVSESCLEWGPGTVPGKVDNEYFRPNTESILYMKNKGMNTIRLPFLWERLQPTLGGSFDATYQGYIDSVVNYATGLGMFVIIDPHNYMRYKLNGNNKVIGESGSGVTTDHFKDLWKRLGGLYKGNDKVMFGLMNEPNSVTTELVLTVMQAGMNGLRESGATQLALVPGNAWTGAHSWNQNWYGTPNAQVMKGITDPQNNFIFEFHQYFDNDYSGTQGTCKTFDSSVVLKDVTDWLRTNKFKGLVGEFGVPDVESCYTAGLNFLQFMEDNSDVYVGWTAWAAGPKWGANDIQVLEPTSFNPLTERPSFNRVFSQYLTDTPVVSGVTSSSSDNAAGTGSGPLNPATSTKSSDASFLSKVSAVAFLVLFAFI
eukprot:TRINITY_DN3342_c0_g1_i6.p1 TRINITY_DN3342_c0_g1~~TRINITY_DN3342_c0_g1_i6.p1  ORF type:complete len:397 (-),score=93.23 TRINITY_DN3342_c0_g1_i6:59-1249(-)